MLAGFSLIFFMIYVDSQYEYHRVWNDGGWLLDKVIPSLAIVVAVIVFISEQRNINRRRKDDETKTICRSCDTILKEVEEIESALYSERFPRTTTDDGIDYTNVHLNTVAFTSISRSALFTQFGSETQNQLSHLYLKISLYNDEYDNAFKLQDNYYLAPKIPGSLEYYKERTKDIEKHLTSLRIEIKDLLPVVKKLVENEKLRPA